MPFKRTWRVLGTLLFLLGCGGGSFSQSQTPSGRGAQNSKLKIGSPQVGRTCPKGTTYQDGCSEGSSGVPEFPDLLNVYRAPPPWNVAGVQYAVGRPQGTILKDPRSAELPPGCQLRESDVFCSSTVIIDGYDFSLHGGTKLVVTGGNVTIQNCLFIVGPNQGPLGRIVDVRDNSSATFLYNEFDGAGIAVTAQQGQTINVTNTGTITFKFNYFHNSGGDMIDFSGGPQVEIVQYNFFKDIGLKTAHSDTLQWCGSIVSNSDISFNTIVQTASGLSGMGLLEANSECAGAAMSYLSVHNNTLISKVRDNFATGANVTQDAGPATADHIAVFHNYIDPTGILNFTASPWFPTGSYHANLPHPSALHTLIDMRSGASIAVPKRRPDLFPHYYVYPDASGYSPSLSDIYSISVTPSTGALSAGNVITFTLDMDEPWQVTGTPKLRLNSGGSALYSGGAGTAQLAFSYIVRTGESAKQLAVVAVDLDGGSITDAFGNVANVSGAISMFPEVSVR
jgi:hypothetical protein